MDPSVYLAGASGGVYSLITAHLGRFNKKCTGQLKDFVNGVEGYQFPQEISRKKTILNMFLSMTASTHIFIYFYSKIKTAGRRLFFNKNPNHFQNNTQILAENCLHTNTETLRIKIL